MSCKDQSDQALMNFLGTVDKLKVFILGRESVFFLFMLRTKKVTIEWREVVARNTRILQFLLDKTAANHSAN